MNGIEGALVSDSRLLQRAYGEKVTFSVGSRAQFLCVKKMFMSVAGG